MIINTLNKDTHYFTLDVHGGAVLPEPLRFKQYDDKSRVLAIELTVHDVSLDLTDARVDIWVYKPDGHLVMKAIDRDSIDLENSTVMVPLTRQMLTTLPSIECEIVVTYANKSVLSFPMFTVEIEDSNIDTDAIISTSEFNLFYDALYRMEQWMRDYLNKYDTIDRAFKTKLDAIEKEKLRIIDEFRILSADLVQQDAIRFEELKQMTIGEFAEWFREAKSLFAYAGREIEKRFNELYEKVTTMADEVTSILTDCQNNQKIIQAIKSEAEKVKAQMDEKYGEMCELYEDAQIKFQEMQNTFTANEANRQQTFESNEQKRATAFTSKENERQSTFEQKELARQNTFDTKETERQNTFTTNETQRQTEFDVAQTNRTNDYELAEDERNTSYSVAEQEREEAYLQAESERQDHFNHSEDVREETFSVAEATRNEEETTRRTNETARVNAESTRLTAETGRVNAENGRVEKFNTMKEQFNTFLQYRYITE